MVSDREWDDYLRVGTGGHPTTALGNLFYRQKQQSEQQQKQQDIPTCKAQEPSEASNFADRVTNSISARLSTIPKWVSFIVAAVTAIIGFVYGYSIQPEMGYVLTGAVAGAFAPFALVGLVKLAIWLVAFLAYALFFHALAGGIGWAVYTIFVP